MAEIFMKLLSTTPLSYEQGKRRKFPNYIVDYFAFFSLLSFLLWKIKDQGFQNSFLSFFILYSDI